ncbi:MAG: type I glyceraldehyde-3-phosphate dehydrogenase [Oligoflexales bacterium]|nr:type I glyceraldehyde-3-phosphate dehydrogenase [Oligoflexales bacterium]
MVRDQNKLRIGLNGFGRIGRTILRASLQPQHRDIQIVHINDLTDPATLAHLLKYDSVHGRLSEDVVAEADGIRVGDNFIGVSSIKSPAELPWGAKSLDLVMECTGIYTKREDCELHLKAGAPKVLISSPAKGEDLTVVYGVNSEKIQKQHKIISNGSCTTNCLAPVVKVIHEHFGIESALMTTIHSYTNDQRILDLPHKDLRRARAAALNMIPTSTGAAKAIGLVIPELKGLIDGVSIRVPTPNVSLVDVTFQLKTSSSIEAANSALQKAAQAELKGILEYTEQALVSSDFMGSAASSVVDGSMTKLSGGGKLLKVFSWYDNECGFSHRMLDVARLMLA